MLFVQGNSFLLWFFLAGCCRVSLGGSFCPSLLACLLTFSLSFSHSEVGKQVWTSFPFRWFCSLHTPNKVQSPQGYMQTYLNRLHSASKWIRKPSYWLPRWAGDRNRLLSKPFFDLTIFHNNLVLILSFISSCIHSFRDLSYKYVLCHYSFPIIILDAQLMIWGLIRRKIIKLNKFHLFKSN